MGVTVAGVMSGIRHDWWLSVKSGCGGHDLRASHRDPAQARSFATMALSWWAYHAAAAGGARALASLQVAWNDANGNHPSNCSYVRWHSSHPCIYHGLQ